jgi:hypothetical protein
VARHPRAVYPAIRGANQPGIASLRSSAKRISRPFG